MAAASTVALSSAQMEALRHLVAHSRSSKLYSPTVSKTSPMFSGLVRHLRENSGAIAIVPIENSSGGIITPTPLTASSKTSRAYQNHRGNDPQRPPRPARPRASDRGEKDLLATSPLFITVAMIGCANTIPRRRTESSHRAPASSIDNRRSARDETAAAIGPRDSAARSRPRGPAFPHRSRSPQRHPILRHCPGRQYRYPPVRRFQNQSRGDAARLLRQPLRFPHPLCSRRSQSQAHRVPPHPRTPQHLPLSSSKSTVTAAIQRCPGPSPMPSPSP